LDAKRIAAVIDEVAAAIGDWPSQAKVAGVTRNSTTLVRDAHARVLADFQAG
jgi:hypothetical protein